MAILAAWVTGASAQGVDALRTRLHKTAESSAIDTPGMLPWHLKLEVQLFDDKGKPSEKGTIEQWWVSPEMYRRTYSFPSYTSTELFNEGGFFRTKDADSPPSLVLDMIERTVRPMPINDPVAPGEAKPDLRKEKFGKVELDCIMLDEPLKNTPYPPLGLFPTYCLDPGKDNLRISTELGSVTIFRNAIGNFRGHSVAVDTLARDGEVVVAKAHVATLTGMKPSELDQTVTPEMVSAGTHSVNKIAGAVIAGSILKKVPPIYPAEAKAKHIAGTVTLKAIIGRDGRVISLHILSTPDASLAMAAVAAVRQWTYKPYLLNGLPTEVDTTISVNFSFEVR